MMVIISIIIEIQKKTLAIVCSEYFQTNLSNVIKKMLCNIIWNYYKDEHHSLVVWTSLFKCVLASFYCLLIGILISF